MARWDKEKMKKDKNIKCYCGFEAETSKDFVWTKFEQTDRLVLICFNCASVIHTKHIAKGVE